MRVLSAILLFGAFFLGCQAELQHDLAESEANEILVLLAEHGIAGTKTTSGPGGRFVVHVPSTDATRAWQLLQANGLPRRPVDGFAETFGEPGLIPSATENQVRLLRATAGELERSIMTMPGVLDARVHLVQPISDRFAGTGASDARPQASVLVVYRSDQGGASPIDEAAVRRLVAGAVADLPPEHIEIVTSSRTADAPAADEAIAPLGPFTVGRASAGPLRVVLAVAGALIVGLSAALVLTVFRLRRIRRTSRGAA